MDGYFDAGDVPKQLGLQVVVQPSSIGPFSFGTAVRASAGSTLKPGAFSITALKTQNAEDENRVRELSRQVAAEMLSMKGFIGWVGVTIADRKLTITAWENAGDPVSWWKAARHAEAMTKFFGPELGAGGYTAVFAADHINATWVRCTSCQAMVDYIASREVVRVARSSRSRCRTGRSRTG